jgi:hypothetical protein
MKVAKLYIPPPIIIVAKQNPTALKKLGLRLSSRNKTFKKLLKI